MRTELRTNVGVWIPTPSPRPSSLSADHGLKDAGTISRRQFVRQLNEALPLALDAMTRESEGLHSPVAPVDLSQAIIGPGMAIFSRYDAVLEADGTPMTVKTALQLINRFLAEDDFDPDTQFCLHWFEQHGWETGKFGEADTLARAKGTSVAGVQAGRRDRGRRRQRAALKWKEYPADWDPRTTPAFRSGRPCTSSSARTMPTATAARPRCWPAWPPRPKPPGSWPTGFTPLRTGRSGRGRPGL